MNQTEKASLHSELNIDGDSNVVGDNNTVSVVKQATGDGNVIGNDNVVSVFKQTAGDHSIQIGTLHLRVPPISPLLRNFLVAGVAFIFLATAAILSLQLRQFQKPRQMTGEFNVAIAEIAAVDSDGNPVKSNDGKALAEFLTQRLETYFEEIDGQSIRYEIWSPDNTNKITGRNSEERARSAESLAQRINAHIVVYGVIISEGDRSRFIPEFFVNYKGFEQAQEATGAHQLGASMLVPLPFDKTKLQAVENPALAARVKGLSFMTVGLAYYSIDNFEEALDYFGRAAATEGWTDTAGKEVVYLLKGNAYVRLASDENTTSYLQLAEDSYSEALKINPNYTRATLGLSGVLYLESLGDPDNPSFQTVSLEGLEEAEQMLLNIQALKDLPASVNYQAKINFRLGQIYLVRAQVSGESLPEEQARTRFMEVIQEYEMGNQQIVDLAGHTHAKLGLIEFLQDNMDEAIAHYKAAIEMVTPHYQAHYASLLGEIYLSTGEKELAIDAYELAIQTAEFYGDEEGISKYSQRLSEIERE